MIIDSIIQVKQQELTRKQWAKLLGHLTFADADENLIEAYDVRGSTVRIPRGSLDMLPVKQFKNIHDFRTKPPMPKLTFARELDGEDFKGQNEALAAMFKHEYGQVIRPPGTGKTNIALAFAAACETRTLVVVHTKRLFDQWLAEIAAAVPDATVGQIRGKTFEVGHITVAMAQTLKRYITNNKKLWRRFGCLIIDEEHHAAAETWEWILNVCPAYYRFGFTATVKRADRREPLIRLLIGPVIHKHKFQSPYPLTIVPVESGFEASFNGLQYSKLLRQLTEDEERNRRIAHLAMDEIAAGNSIVILSEQIKHLELIYEAIKGTFESLGFDTSEVALLTGRVANKRQQQVLSGFKDRSISCVLATRIFDEGLDVPVINRVILAFPGKHETPIIQRIGRALRKWNTKENVVVYDIVDDLVPVFVRQFMERKIVYKSMQATLGEAVRYGKKGNVIDNRSLSRKGLAKEVGRKLRDSFRPRRPTRA